MNTWFRQGQRGLIFSELQTMKAVIERVFSIVDEEVESAEKRFQSQCEVIPDEGLDGAREDLWISQNLVPRHIINALFMSLFTLFEDQMVQLCECIGNQAEHANDHKIIEGHTEKEKAKTKLFKEFKSGGIGLGKCKEYLIKIFKINYPSWNEIEKIKNLRNMIAHNNGKFMNRKKTIADRVRAHINESEFLSGNEEFDDIIIDRQYLSYAERVFMSSIEKIISEVEDKKLL